MYLNPNVMGYEAKKLQHDLSERVVGQEEAILAVVNIYQQFTTGLNPPNRPIGNFLFLGPTGSGKTYLVESLADSLLGNPHAIIKVDCAEYSHGHEIAKLVGSPPGYLGHEISPMLSQEALNQHHTEKIRVSFVLFDEIEKADEKLWNLLLGITDKAKITLGDNRCTNFAKSLIFMTSNIGAKEMESLVRPNFGFVFGQTSNKTTRLAQKTGEAAMRRKFTPEFINRLDKIIVFNTLSVSDFRNILEIELKNLSQRIALSVRPFYFGVSEKAKEYILKEGVSEIYGARHLKRAIERLLLNPLTNLVASGQIKTNEFIHIDYDNSITFKKINVALSISV